jgi:hypothetical protein
MVCLANRTASRFLRRTLAVARPPDQRAAAASPMCPEASGLNDFDFFCRMQEAIPHRAVPTHLASFFLEEVV